MKCGDKSEHKTVKGKSKFRNVNWLKRKTKYLGLKSQYSKNRVCVLHIADLAQSLSPPAVIPESAEPNVWPEHCWVLSLHPLKKKRNIKTKSNKRKFDWKISLSALLWKHNKRWGICNQQEVGIKDLEEFGIKVLEEFGLCPFFI